MKINNQNSLYITPDTTILSFDVESNGLHGEAFAVGAVLVNMKGEVLEEFQARCPIEGAVDEWVADNVLGPMKNVPEDQPDAKALRAAFWQWYKAVVEKTSYVVVANVYPVEARFLIQCQDDDQEARYWDHPFPLFDLPSMLLARGLKPLGDRAELAGDLLNGTKLERHNPRWDAQLTALAAASILRQTA